MPNNKFKVSYNVQNLDQKSSRYGYISFDQNTSFPTLQSAMKFAKEMTNKRTNKMRVIGIPVIETL